MELWLLLVNHKFQAIGGRFSVKITSSDFNINDVKKGVGGKRSNAFSRAGIDSSDLTVWRTKGSMIIDRSTVKRLAEILREINVGDKDTIEKLSEDEQMADLGFSESQTLLSEDIRQKCCCPTFLVATGDPWFSVLGGVFTDRFIVQRLTDMSWMALSKREEDSRVYRNARVLVALRNCLVKLQTFYRALEGPSTFIANKPHPRYFPYPTSFTAKDEDPACVSYLVEILNGPSARRGSDPAKGYGKEPHEYLARKGWAPALRYCGPLLETELYGVFPGPAQSAPPGLHLRSGPMHMVVISTLYPTHRQMFVAAKNIVFDAYGKLKLIDFDWCGRYDMNIRDENLPYDLQNQIDKNKACVQVGDGPYAYYPLSTSTIEGMWDPGMERLAPIRPKHDWMMFDKLSW
ncbi:hypothetical protein EDB87DRAFT_1823595 [Lactarius vividus]|nr:hypothetical protein EDB87DRAFT_1823595 [Lactarius vividus]